MMMKQQREWFDTIAEELARATSRVWNKTGAVHDVAILLRDSFDIVAVPHLDGPMPEWFRLIDEAMTRVPNCYSAVVVFAIKGPPNSLALVKRAVGVREACVVDLRTGESFMGYTPPPSLRFSLFMDRERLLVN